MRREHLPGAVCHVGRSTFDRSRPATPGPRHASRRRPPARRKSARSRRWRSVPIRASSSASGGAWRRDVRQVPPRSWCRASAADLDPCRHGPRSRRWQLSSAQPRVSWSEEAKHCLSELPFEPVIHEEDRALRRPLPQTEKHRQGRYRQGIRLCLWRSRYFTSLSVIHLFQARGTSRDGVKLVCIRFGTRRPEVQILSPRQIQSHTTHPGN
jgi:hypothetical protein